MGETKTFLRKIQEFADLSEDELARIEKICFTRRYKKNMVVFLEGEPLEAIHFIKSGRVKISKLAEDGREQIINILGEGDLFPHMGLFEKVAYPATAEVIEDAELGVIRTAQFEDLLRQNPDLAVSMLRVMSKMLRGLQSTIRDLAFKDSFGRTASALLRLAREHGVQSPQGLRLNMPLTHQELANLVGVSRETVTRIISQFRKEKAVEMDRRGITIVNQEKLKRWL